MEQGKQGILGLKLSPQDPQNPIQQIQARFQEVQNGIQAWLKKQPLAVEAAVVTAGGAFQGAALGALMGSLTGDISPPAPPEASLNPQAMASFKQAQALSGGPLVQARNFAVMTGVNAGIACVMKRLRGKEDVQSRAEKPNVTKMEDMEDNTEIGRRKPCGVKKLGKGWDSPISNSP